MNIEYELQLIREGVFSSKIEVNIEDILTDLNDMRKRIMNFIDSYKYKEYITKINKDLDKGINIERLKAIIKEHSSKPITVLNQYNNKGILLEGTKIVMPIAFIDREKFKEIDELKNNPSLEYGLKEPYGGYRSYEYEKYLLVQLKSIVESSKYFIFTEATQIPFHNRLVYNRIINIAPQYKIQLSAYIPGFYLNPRYTIKNK